MTNQITYKAVQLSKQNYAVVATKNGQRHIIATKSSTSEAAGYIKNISDKEA